MLPNIGAPELIIILVIALLILGPGKLPEVGSSLGKSIREFRKASSDVQEAVNVSVDTSPLPPTPAAPVAPASPAATQVPTATGAPAAPVTAPPAETSTPASTPSADSTTVAS